ncbi:ABC transporter substrate-binding protein [Thermofilum pendens]|uniref:Extracellular ligand-binding receptor n=1 Tax=Thermofilum pendens (strain DSM 2475 / Hrk 5) TaxID=368408 RepID=A1RWX5_THEPD|nr:ABC transporter substrate-binding protein [Thermofilum pendens]ABL77705.1 Extracellular ligand-binding receptor [Thermofilum pendens Hrk 5]
MSAGNTVAGKSSLARVLAYIVIALLIGAFLGYFLRGYPAQQQAATTQTSVTTIPIGALVELSGDLSSYGKRDELAMQIAIEDVNNFAEKIGSPYRFKLLVEDSGTSPEQALSRIKTLAAQGVRAVIGLEASSEVAAVKQFADTNHVVVLSVGSTALSLAIPGDYILRVVPPDSVQSKALARLIYSLGYRNVAVIYRNDAWGVGLFEGFSARFKELGGNVAGVAYDPAAKDLSGEVNRLADIAASMGSNTAVLAITFEDDGIQIVKLAARNPVLSKLKWFGTDGVAQSTKLASEAGEELIALGGFPCTIFQPSENQRLADFVNRFRSRSGGEDPHAYAMNAYDAVWLVALSVMLTGSYSGDKLLSTIPLVAQNFNGITGPLTLDANGDRASGDYAIWRVVKTANGYDWQIIGWYSASSDSVTIQGG